MTPKTCLTIFAAVTLGIFSFGVLRPMQSSKGHHAAGSQCVSVCLALPSQLRLEDIQPQDDLPEPIAAAPYYASFLGGMHLIVAVTGFFSAWHLRWRPPDLVIQYSALRI